jgi:hypothetical protein
MQGFGTGRFHRFDPVRASTTRVPRLPAGTHEQIKDTEAAPVEPYTHSSEVTAFTSGTSLPRLDGHAEVPVVVVVVAWATLIVPLRSCLSERKCVCEAEEKARRFLRDAE